MTTETAAKSSEFLSASKKLAGVVKQVDLERRSGFITPDVPIEGLGVDPIFLATNLMTGLVLDDLSEGDRVEFVIEDYIGKDGIPKKTVRQICLLLKATSRSEHTWKGFKMRSKAEIKIAEELEKCGVFLPNCKARLSASGISLEPDFVVCSEGKWGILEVDGPHHTVEARVKEQERERHFKRYRIFIVERFTADYCLSRPDKVVQEFLELLRST